jgi:hypothetical protein
MRCSNLELEDISDVVIVIIFLRLLQPNDLVGHLGHHLARCATEETRNTHTHTHTKTHTHTHTHTRHVSDKTHTARTQGTVHSKRIAVGMRQPAGRDGTYKLSSRSVHTSSLGRYMQAL